MATNEPFISLPSIHEQGSRGQVDSDADFDSLKRTITQNSRIERYLESTEVHLTGEVLKWNEECGDAFGKDDGGRLSLSHRDTAANTSKQAAAAACRRTVARSKTEPMYLPFPPTRETNEGRPKTWTGGTQPKTILGNTWPGCHARPELPEEKQEQARSDPFGRLHRNNLDFITRQTKQAHKLTYDNMAAKETLRKARDVIKELRAKINRRNTHIKDRREKEGDLVELVESLRRARDEKLQEYKLLVKGMNEALKEKACLLEQMELERAKAEMLYQRQLTENTELLRKIEAREKAIKTLRDKTGKAKKWKDEARS